MIELDSVSKRYGDGPGAVWALREVSLWVRRREFLAVMGPSGSGKSSLLNLIAGLDAPHEGEVRVAGSVVAQLADRQLARLRRSTVTVIFQFFNLLPTLTAEQNVAVPLRADGRSRRETRERVARALDAVAMTHRARHYPSELSGGEMQRVAIARALATDAQVVLADEPTGNLDSARGDEILELLRGAVDREGRTVVMVTHDVRAAAYGDRIITLRDGRIVDEVTGARGAVRVVEMDRVAS
ncbi:ABC transporter ATP-binding protein [Candidatus Binatia bacterium]|nr:ABC transporter ATP-binding protein [Candidatus Binatia bacterium]